MARSCEDYRSRDALSTKKRSRHDRGKSNEMINEMQRWPRNSKYYINHNYRTPHHSVISQLKALKYTSWVWPRKKKNYKNILFLCCKPVTCPTLYQTSCLIRVENIEIELKIQNLKTKNTKSASCLAREAAKKSPENASHPPNLHD